MNGRQACDAVVLVIGAGPAGLFAAGALADKGVNVVLLNRDFKPGGLVEYGIYHSKHRVKSVLRKQFHKILAMPEVAYHGNVTVGDHGDLTFAQLQEMGFSAIVVAVGAQATKWLGLPGEPLTGVHHAKELIYAYNDLPPFSEQTFEIGKRVALIGVGNVMADVARWLVRDLKVDEVVGVARRGPAEVKFTRQEFAHVAANLDLQAFDQEIERVRGRMEDVNQDVDAAKDFILSALKQAEPSISDTRVRFRFLTSPIRIVGDDADHVMGLEVEDTALTLTDAGVTRATRLGSTHVLDVDTVIFCIGDRVSDDFGLPVQWNSFVKHPEPCYAVNGVSFEAYDPECGEALQGVFVVGWAREASTGQVALARKDALGCVSAVSAYFDATESLPDGAAARERLLVALAESGKSVITKQDAFRLNEIETEEAARRGVEAFRFDTNVAMLEVLGLQG
jgi:ferredoxin--NADP+ reductase